MTKIAICGACGKMGRFIYDVISERDDCTVSAGIDKFGEAYADFPVVKEPADLPEKPDVIIDFSHPSALDGLLSYCLSNGTALVIATTGYTEEDTAKIHKASEQIPVFFTFNMTLGINLLANLAKTAAKVLGGQYDIEIIEKHHNQKIDAPSGTAIMLADAINEELDNKYHYVYDRSSVILLFKTSSFPRDKSLLMYVIISPLSTSASASPTLTCGVGLYYRAVFFCRL